MNAPCVVYRAVQRIIHQICACRARLRAVAGTQRNAVELVAHQVHIGGVNVQKRQRFRVGRLAHVLAYLFHVGWRKGQVLQPRLDAPRPARCRLQIFHVAVELPGRERQLPQPPFARAAHYQ